MPLDPFPVVGKVYASDSSSPFPNVRVYLRNKNKNEEKYKDTNELGEFNFDLANFNKAYSSSDSLELRAIKGFFYKKETTTVSGDGVNQDLTLSTSDEFRRIDFNLMNEELIVFLRNNLNDPNERSEDTVDVFTGDGSTVEFTLDNKGKNIKYIKVGSSIKTNYTEYYIDYKDKSTLSKPVLYLLTPPTDGTQVEVKYSKETSSWVYPDFPRLSLKTDDYPRVKTGIISMRTEEFGLGANYNLSEIMVEIIVWSKSTQEMNEIVKNIRNNLNRNKQNFNFFDLIIPSAMGPIISTPERGDNIIQRNLDYIIKLKPEKV